MKTPGKKCGLPMELLERMADRLRTLAHPSRLKILELVEAAGEAPVREIVACAGLPQATVSSHLGLMRRAGIVAARRRGREIWYGVADPDSLTILDCIRKKGTRTS